LEAIVLLSVLAAETIVLVEWEEADVFDCAGRMFAALLVVPDALICASRLAISFETRLLQA